MITPMRPRVVIFVLLGMLSFALMPGAAGAATVHCGDVITQDTTVDNDLSGCPFIGLTVRGNVTLDLNHHTISGTGDWYGIDVGSENGTASVRDGTVTGFHAGVLVVGKATTAYVTHMTATGNHLGFQAGRGTVLFEQNLAIGNLADGFYARTSPGTSVDATFTKNRAYANGHLGINTNNTDGGKNHAHKNGDPRQCIGVECRP
jgi:hypothetical protein